MYSLLMRSRRISGGGVTVAVTGSLVAAGAVVTNAGACWRDSWMMSQWYSQTGTPTATAEAKANSEASSFCMLSDVIRRKTYMLRTLVIAPISPVRAMTIPTTVTRYKKMMRTTLRCYMDTS